MSKRNPPPHHKARPKKSKKPPLKKTKPRGSMDHPSARSPKAIPALELDLGAHLTAFLKKLPLEALGRLTHLVERIPKKITPLHLVTAGLLLLSQPYISLTVWALLLGLLSRQTVSKQGVFERLDQAAVDFFKAVLGCALGQRMQPLATKARSGRGPFGRILVQDSSTARLNE